MSSDVYAAGATMRACIEGKPPPSAVERHAKDELVPAIELAMETGRKLLQAREVIEADETGR